MSECPVQINDVIRCPGIFDNAWRDGETESEPLDGKIMITDGSIWVSHSKPPEDTTRTICWEHQLSDEEKVEVFKKTGKLGPEKETREGEVTVTRRVPLYGFGEVVVVRHPKGFREGVWLVKVAPLNPAGDDNQIEYNFSLLERGIDIGILDEKKVVHEGRVFIRPRSGKPLFGPWSSFQTEVSLPKVGNVVSGAELRWYLFDADRTTEYIVTCLKDVRRDIKVCAVSSTPRDCRDDWCCIRHHHKTITVKAGISIEAQKVHIDPETGQASLLGGIVSWFYAMDRDFRSTMGSDKIHVGGDRNRNFIFVIPETA